MTEVGTSNFFILWKNEEGEDELITHHPNDNLILHGVTRDSVLKLTKEMNRFKVTEAEISMKRVLRALKEKRVYTKINLISQNVLIIN